MFTCLGAVICNLTTRGFNINSIIQINNKKLNPSLIYKKFYSIKDQNSAEFTTNSNVLLVIVRDYINTGSTVSILKEDENIMGATCHFCNLKK